jgi:arylsulfatase A-like enzyme
LSISFSSTDIIAHAFGPHSVEVEDTYLRLDKDLAELLTLLDKQVGKDNYVVFLTADHGAAEVSGHMRDLKIPAGSISDKSIKKELQGFMSKEYGDSSLVLDVGNEQVFLDLTKITAKQLPVEQVEEAVAQALLGISGIAEAYSGCKLKYESYSERDTRFILQNGFNQLRSGNVLYTLQPGWMDNAPIGTTHGAGYNYDTHVPVIFYGAGIPKGETLNYVTITQIAPSVCELMGIQQPNACMSAILKEIFK